MSRSIMMALRQVAPLKNCKGKKSLVDVGTKHKWLFGLQPHGIGNGSTVTRQTDDPIKCPDELHDIYQMVGVREPRLATCRQQRELLLEAYQHPQRSLVRVAIDNGQRLGEEGGHGIQAPQQRLGARG